LEELESLNITNSNQENMGQGKGNPYVHKLTHDPDAIQILIDGDS
jgi:hypothetical protein